MTTHRTPLVTCPDWCTVTHAPEDLSHSAEITRHGDFVADIVQPVEITDDNCISVGEPVAALCAGGNVVVGEIVATQCRDLANAMTPVPDLVAVLNDAADWLDTHA